MPPYPFTRSPRILSSALQSLLLFQFLAGIFPVVALAEPPIAPIAQRSTVVDARGSCPAGEHPSRQVAIDALLKQVYLDVERGDVLRDLSNLDRALKLAQEVTAQPWNCPHPLAPSPRAGEGEPNQFKVPLPTWERDLG